MPEVDEPGASRPWDLGNPCGREHLGKRLGAHGPCEWTATAGDKEMRVKASHATAPGEILLERRTGGGMQREKAAFLELRGPNAQPIGSHSLPL